MMKKNNSGYISAISLLIMAFLLLLTAAVVPRVRAELNFTSINSDGVEAQYAAEAGVKYAAAQILNNPSNTDWGWARGNQALTLVDGETYTITIFPIASDGTVGNTAIDDGVALASGNKYLIKSVGRVNDYSKTVKAIAHINSGTSANTPAIYAGNTLTASGSLTVTNGDILADVVNLSGGISISSGNKALYYTGKNVPNGVTAEKWTGEKYTYQPDESVITSLPSFSALTNINGYTVNYSSYGKLPNPVVVKKKGTTYTLASNTKYYMPSGLPSASNTIYIEKPDDGDVTITLNGAYTTSDSGSGTIINLDSTGAFVLNVLGDMTARSFTINADKASSVTVNVKGKLTTNGSGIVIHGPANGNMNLNVSKEFTVGGGGITIDGMNTGSVNITVDGNYDISGYGGHITRPASGDVNILVNGNLTAQGAGLPITGNSTGNINLLVGGTLTSAGSGIAINSATGNVNIYSNKNLTASGSGLTLNGSSVKVVANGDITLSGNNSLDGNALLYAIGNNHDITASGSFSIEGSIIAADGDITLSGNTNVHHSNANSGSGGSGSGTGTIEFTDWSS